MLCWDWYSSWKQSKQRLKVAHRPLRLIAFPAMEHEAAGGIFIPPPPWRECQSIAGSPYRSISPINELSIISIHFIRFMRMKDHSVIRSRLLCLILVWRDLFFDLVPEEYQVSVRFWMAKAIAFLFPRRDWGLCGINHRRWLHLSKWISWLHWPTCDHTINWQVSTVISLTFVRRMLHVDNRS